MTMSFKCNWAKIQVCKLYMTKFLCHLTPYLSYLWTQYMKIGNVNGNFKLGLHHS